MAHGSRRALWCCRALSIGAGALIAAGEVVRSDIPDYTLLIDGQQRQHRRAQVRDYSLKRRARSLFSVFAWRIFKDTEKRIDRLINLETLREAGARATYSSALFALRACLPPLEETTRAGKIIVFRITAPVGYDLVPNIYLVRDKNGNPCRRALPLPRSRSSPGERAR